MKRITLLALLSFGCAGLEGLPLDPALLPTAGGTPDESTVIAGLREALEVGAKRSVDRVGRRQSR